MEATGKLNDQEIITEKAKKPATLRDKKNDGGIAAIGLDIGVFAVKGVLVESGGIVDKVLIPSGGNPANVALKCLKKLMSSMVHKKFTLGITGNNARLITAITGTRPVLEVEALQDGLTFSGDRAEMVISLGHENIYYVELDPLGRVTFFNRNGQCAAGSGSFWYQQATRMGYNDQELAEIALEAPSAVKISGRCAVFAKSDMTHAINEGASQSAVAAGLAKALVDLVVAGVAQNRISGPGTLVITGGVAGNKAVLKFLGEYCLKREIKLIIPDDASYINALGASQKGTVFSDLEIFADSALKTVDFIAKKLLGKSYKTDKTLIPLNPREVKYEETVKKELKSADLSVLYLGVDCGSVSTKCALLDGAGRFIGGVYLPTSGRPALQVLELIKKIKEKFGWATDKKIPLIICTTGSGRFLARKILNAGYAIDEITCQAEGVKSLCEEDTLSIIEIGGEDSKFVQIKNGLLYDYNMNPVCAAGTGTFLENLSGLLGVKIKKEFSEKAFKADYAIDLGDTCTLLSQSTLFSASSRGLPLEEQLASLAYSSARNYLSKTVEGRTLDGKLIFTGATARNHALAAAFAAECGREIFIPPNPELTGAKGAALMAMFLWEEDGRPLKVSQSLERFNDFGIKKRSCKASCLHEHNCRLDVITFSDKTKFIYGDRCGRYSEMEKTKEEKENSPNYELIRQNIFLKAAGEEPDAITGSSPGNSYPDNVNRLVPNSDKTLSKTVGIASGGLYYELYPFWSAYFRSLGAEIILSGHSHEKILEKGKANLSAEMCYPIEVLIGHYRELKDKNPDYIFIPEVIDMEPLPWEGKWPRSLSCPLLMMTKGVVVHSLNIAEDKVLDAQLNYRDGFKIISRQMIPVSQKFMGDSFSKKAHIQAIKEGYLALNNFQRDLEKEGARIIENLTGKTNESVAIILGRSYTLCDPFISKEIFKHAAQRGLQAVSQDFLLEYLRGWYTGRIKSSFLEPFRGEFKSYMNEKIDNMDNIYAIQLQNIISAALAVSFINERAVKMRMPELNLILQDPFRCGPNSILRHYLDNICGYLRLTLDEHTAPAGMITRLEAFKNTCRSRNDDYKPPVFYTAKTTPAHYKGIKKVLIPNSSKHPQVVASLLESYGVDADVLPKSSDKDLTMARRYSNGEECLPFIQNMQDYLEYAEDNFCKININGKKQNLCGNEGEEGVYLFQGWACGPCRYGLYAPTQSMLLNRAGFGGKKVSAFKINETVKRFGPEFAILSYDGMLAVDLLYKMLHQIRPYEINKGDAEHLFNKYCDQVYALLRKQRFKIPGIIAGMHLKMFEKILKEAAVKFNSISRTDEELRPRIMVAGEFYVRIDERCNQEIVKKIEEAGGEVSLAPATEFFIYTVYANYRKAKKDFELNRNPVTYLSKVGYKSIYMLAWRDEHRLEKAASFLLCGHEEPTPKEIRKRAQKYIPEHTAGEPPMTMGRTGAMTDRERIAGAIFVGPFTCMPASVVEAQQGILSKELDIPICSVYYDGRDNSSREEFIHSLVFQAKQNMALKK